MNSQWKGCFIVFEGLDGSGKSTQVRDLGTKLQKKKYEVITTQEPTKKSVIGSLINRILYNKAVVPDEVLALLFAADRADHTINTIIPALEKGSIVISDRYVYSSLAYQSRGMKKRFDLDWVQSINQAAIEPDLVIFLDATPEDAMSRLQKGQKRVQDHNFFENLEVQTRIRDAYYDIFNFHQADNEIQNTSTLRIDAKLTVKQIKEIIGERISMLLKKKNIGLKKNIKKNNGNLKEFFSGSEDSGTSVKKGEKTGLNVSQTAQDSPN